MITKKRQKKEKKIFFLRKKGRYTGLNKYITLIKKFSAISLLRNDK